MKYLLILSMLFLMSCGSGDDSNDADTVPVELIGLWVRDCNTVGFDSGYLNTTQATTIEFIGNTRSITTLVYDGDDCTGNILSEGGHEGEYSEIKTILSRDGVEGIAAKVTISDGDVVYFSYHLNGDFMYLGSWFPGATSSSFNFSEPFYKSQNL
ncbi:MAG: hypothetical protein K6L81_18055 [Agarilytica sp.]